MVYFKNNECCWSIREEIPSKEIVFRGVKDLKANTVHLQHKVLSKWQATSQAALDKGSLASYLNYQRPIEQIYLNYYLRCSHKITYYQLFISRINFHWRISHDISIFLDIRFSYCRFVKINCEIYMELKKPFPYYNINPSFIISSSHETRWISFQHFVAKI